MATTQATQAAQATEQAKLAGTIRVAVPEHSLRTDAARREHRLAPGTDPLPA